MKEDKVEKINVSGGYVEIPESVLINGAAQAVYHEDFYDAEVGDVVVVKGSASIGIADSEPGDELTSVVFFWFEVDGVGSTVDVIPSGNRFQPDDEVESDIGVKISGEGRLFVSDGEVFSSEIDEYEVDVDEYAVDVDEYEVYED